MILVSVVFSTVAMCASALSVAISLGYLCRPKPKEDKFDHYRDPVSGLLKGKKVNT